jgi:ABC-type glycerol-3-phosphate transport system substrate-binding protein
MKKKVLKTLVSLVVCGTMLFAAACNGSGGGANNPGGGGMATLDFLYAGTQEILELYTALVNEYNATQGKEDRIRVMGMPIPVGSVNDKLTNVLPSSNGPDVVIGTDEYFKPHTKNMLDISDAFSSELLGSLYERQEIRYHYDAENITANESDPLYALPSVNDPTVLYYNKDALKAAGVICISVDEKDLAAFNAGTFTDLNGMKKSDYGLEIDVPAKGYFRSNNPYRFNGSDYSGSSWKKPTTGTVLVFNDRIACSWDEIEDLGMLLTKSKNSKSTTDYGYYTEWWFNYGWSVGGDCLQDMNGKGDFTYSLPSTMPNFIVTEGNTYKGLYTGKIYAAGDTIELADVINADPTDTIAYDSENNTTFYYTVNGKKAVVRPDITEKTSSGVLNELPCTQEAFKRFCMLAGTGGLNICPYPSAFNGTSSQQYFSSGVLAMLVQYYSNYKVIKDSSTFEWGIAPLPIFKEYTDDAPTTDTVKRMGQSANHSLGYYVAIRKGTPIKDQCVKFVTWLMTKGQTFAAENGFVSAQKADFDTAVENLAKKVGKASALAIMESSAVSRAGDWWYMPDRWWIDNWANPLNQKVRYGSLSFETYIYGYTEVSNKALKAYRGK